MKDTICFDMDPTFLLYKDPDPLTELTVYGKIHVKFFHLSCFFVTRYGPACLGMGQLQLFTHMFASGSEEKQLRNRTFLKNYSNLILPH